MSIDLMTMIWKRTDLDQSETLVGLALADHADEETGECWPSIERIAQKARLQRRATQNVIQRLEALGIITVERGVGRRNTNIYRFHVENKDASAAPLHQIKGASRYRQKVHPGTEKVHLDDIKGAPANAPESSLTIIESSIEPSARTRRASKRCPQEFQVDVDLLAWAASECPNVDAEAETQKFRDHEFKNARSDWAATWRNWIRGAKDRMGSANGKNGSSGSPRVSAVERVKRATDQWARERGIDPSTL